MKTPLTDEFLQSIEGISETEPAPYFYTRLKVRMEKKSEIISVWKPAMAFALSVFLALNIYFLSTNTKTEKNNNPVQEFANSYHLSGDFNY